MKKSLVGLNTFIFLCLVVPWIPCTTAVGQYAWEPSVGRTAPISAPASGETFMDRWVLDRVEVGARIHRFRLRDTRRRGPNGYDNWNLRQNYIGSVWGLDEKQDYLPRLHLNYRVWQGFGLGLSYDKVIAQTVDWGNVEKTVTTTDGDISVRGPLLYAFGRYVNRTRWTPTIELGYARYSASFDVNPQWAAVAPGYRFEVDDTTGYYLALGCDVAVGERCALNVQWRRMYDAEVDARAYFTPSSRVGRYGAFPMEYTMYGIGATYLF